MLPKIRPVSRARLIAFVLLAGCNDVEPYAPHAMITDPEQLYMRLALNHRAINLSTASPYDTVRLLAVPRDANGNAMPGMPAPTYISSDTSVLTVTADGLLQARAQGFEIRVLAELAIEGNVRHTDTAWVSITDDPSPRQLATFSIDPVPPDSAVWSSATFEGEIGMGLLSFAGVDLLPRLNVRALDANGDQIDGLEIEYESLTPTVVSVDKRRGISQVPRAGQAILVARTNAYGVARVDTTVYTVTTPIVNGVFLPNAEWFGGAMRPTEVTVRPGGWVFWVLFSDDQKGVVFDEPTRALAVEPVCNAFGGPFCDAGDIPPFGSTTEMLDIIRGRQFREPGVYAYRSTNGKAGKIIVSDTPQ